MSTHLDRVQNWQELAEEVHWSVAAMAKRVGTSVRVLERHFLQNVGKSPKAWLVEQRQKRAKELLDNGRSVKETADGLGYQHANHFSREFKAYWGFCPSTLAASNQPEESQCRILV